MATFQWCCIYSICDPSGWNGGYKSYITHHCILLFGVERESVGCSLAGLTVWCLLRRMLRWRQQKTYCNNGGWRKLASELWTKYQTCLHSALICYVLLSLMQHFGYWSFAYSPYFNSLLHHWISITFSTTHMGKRFVSPRIWFKASQRCLLVKRFSCSLGLVSLCIRWKNLISSLYFQKLHWLIHPGFPGAKTQDKNGCWAPPCPHNIVYVSK